MTSFQPDTTLSNSEIDILLYKIEHVLLYIIPPPSSEDGFKHNISRWNIDGNALWEGSLEMHEIELVEDLSDQNPFYDKDHGEAGAKSPFIHKDPRRYFKLKLTLIDPVTGTVFAQIPNYSSLNIDEESIIPTDSSKLYAVFPEIDSDVELKIKSVRHSGKEDVGTENSNVKRVGLGLKLPSSYEASNFIMYLSQFKKDYEIFAKTLREDVEDYNQAKKEEISAAKAEAGEAKMDTDENDENKKVSLDRNVDDLRNQFDEIDVNDRNPTEDGKGNANRNARYSPTSATNKLESESDDDDDDTEDEFGEFTEA